MPGTAHYVVQVGKDEIKFEGPDGLTDKQIERLADQHLRTARPGQTFKPSNWMGPEPSDAQPARDPSESSGMGAFLRGSTRESTFNIGDEISAYGNAAIPGLAELDNAFGGTTQGQRGPLTDRTTGDLVRGETNDFWGRVKHNQQAFKDQYAADDELHPVVGAAGKIAGVVSSLPRAGAAIAARIPEALAARIATKAAAHPVATVLGAGTVGGTVSGAGAGEQGTRAQSAALGAITGFATAGAVRTAGELAPWLVRNGRILLNKGADSEAIRQIIQSLKRDRFDVSSPSGVAKLKAALQDFTGKPVSLADIGGASRARTGVGLRAPSDAQQQAIDVVHSRQAGQGQRLADDVRANVAPRTDVHALDEQLVAQRAADAKVLRDKALFEDAPVPPPTGRPQIEQVQDPQAGVLRTLGGNPDDKFARVADNNNKPSVAGWATAPEAMDAEAGLARWNKYPFHSDAQVNTPQGRGTIFASSVDNVAEGVPASGDVIIKLNDTGEMIKVGAHEVDSIYAKPKFGVITGGGQVPDMGRTSRIVDDGMLQGLARLPFAQRALTHALELSKSEVALLASQGKSIDHLPDLNRGSDLDVRTFDTLKRYLDNEVNMLYKRGAGNTYSMAEANQVKDLRNAIRDRLRVAVPEYGDYLDAYKGSSEMIDSLAAGQTYNQLPKELISAGQAKRSDAGRELFRVGAARNILDTIRETKTTGNAASRILNSPEAVDQLAATGVSSGGMAALTKSVGQERQMNLLGQELTGAQTNQRAMAQADANVGADIQVPFNPGSPLGWAGMLGRRVLNHTSGARNAAVNESLLPQMLETNPAAIEAVIARLEQSGNAAAAKLLRRQALERRSAVVGGTMIGSPVSLQNEDQ